MQNLLANHGVWIGIGLMWSFSAFVGGMPEPDSSSGKGYRWFYGSLHMLAANLDKVGSSIKPPLK